MIVFAEVNHDLLNNLFNTDYYKGVAAALLSAVTISYTVFTFKRLKGGNLLTFTHVLCLMTLLFLPAFFSMQNIVGPSILRYSLFNVYFLFNQYEFVKS